MPKRRPIATSLERNTQHAATPQLLLRFDNKNCAKYVIPCLRFFTKCLGVSQLIKAVQHLFLRLTWATMTDYADRDLALRIRLIIILVVSTPLSDKCSYIF